MKRLKNVNKIQREKVLKEITMEGVDSKEKNEEDGSFDLDGTLNYDDEGFGGYQDDSIIFE
jgi:hypothetical protein